MGSLSRRRYDSSPETRIDAMDVIGVGDADVDIYLYVDHIPGWDEKILARRMELYPGGMVANFLAALGRLGTVCGFHGPVGDDDYGRMTLADLKASGVNITGAVVKSGEQTYFCSVMLDASGEKALIVAPTSCLFPTPDDVSENTIAQARHLHTTAATVATAEKAVRLAKRHGLSVSLDLEPSAAQQGVKIAGLVSMVDLLFVNERALALLGDPVEPERIARAVLSRGTKIVCVTSGKNGSATFTATDTFRTAAFQVPVVDTTGAGDCFAAGFVHGYLKGWSLPQTATFASAVAALSIGGHGGHAAAPRVAEVAAFLRERGIDTPLP